MIHPKAEEEEDMYSVDEYGRCRGFEPVPVPDADGFVGGAGRFGRNLRPGDAVTIEDGGERRIQRVGHYIHAGRPKGQPDYIHYIQVEMESSGGERK